MPSTARTIASLTLPAALLAALSVPVTGARAGDVTYCVTCDGPAATYRCHIAGDNVQEDSRGLQLYCIVRTAREKNHDTCMIRKVALSACQGRLVSFDYRGPELNRDADGAVDSVLGRRNPAGTFRNDREDRTTLIEATGSAVRGTRRRLGDMAERTGHAGHRVGEAARNALHCVRSLFRDCHGDDSDEHDSRETAAVQAPLPITPPAPDDAQAVPGDGAPAQAR